MRHLSISFDEGVQLILLLCFSISLSLVGTFLFLRKKSMVANAISHTVLFGIALLFIVMKAVSGETHFGLLSMRIGDYVLVSVITTFITIFLIEGLRRYTKLNNDASTALVFSTLFSIGAILITMFTKSAHVGVDIIMGNLDLVHINDFKMALIVFALCASFVYLFFRDLVVLSFDGMIVKLSNKNGVLIQAGFLFITSLVISSGFRCVGIAPVLGLIIIPPVTASLMTKSVKDLVIFCVVTNALVGVLSIVLTKFFWVAYGVGLSTSGMLVTLHFLLFLGVLIKKRVEVSA
ncbi:metal ABC transporter permease [bacterium]|nr:metal ABC transporter permease [bacterium]